MELKEMPKKVSIRALPSACHGQLPGRTWNLFIGTGRKPHEVLLSRIPIKEILRERWGLAGITNGKLKIKLENWGNGWEHELST